jgi:hypothetical protein
MNLISERQIRETVNVDVETPAGFRYNRGNDTKRLAIKTVFLNRKPALVIPTNTTNFAFFV